jgi:hypothetical protein
MTPLAARGRACLVGTRLCQWLIRFTRARERAELAGSDRLRHPVDDAPALDPFHRLRWLVGQVVGRLGGSPDRVDGHVARFQRESAQPADGGSIVAVRVAVRSTRQILSASLSAGDARQLSGGREDQNSLPESSAWRNRPYGVPRVLMRTYVRRSVKAPLTHLPPDLRQRTFAHAGIRILYTDGSNGSGASDPAAMLLDGMRFE